MKHFLVNTTFFLLLSINAYADKPFYEQWLALSALPSLTVTSNVQGRITQLDVMLNQMVTAGTVLLTVADPILDEKQDLLKNRYESALKTLAKQENLFKKNRIDYAEYLYARNQLEDAALAYQQFVRKNNQTVVAPQNMKINKIYVRTKQDIYYGMPLFVMTPSHVYRLTAKLPFEYLKKLGINKKIILFDDQNHAYPGNIESLDIQGRDFFLVIKVIDDQLKPNQKLKLTFTN